MVGTGLNWLQSPPQFSTGKMLQLSRREKKGGENGKCIFFNFEFYVQIKVVVLATFHGSLRLQS
jgi:hypothetical protein